MSNPPGWVAHSKLAKVYGDLKYGELSMAGISAGVVTAGDVNSPLPATGSSSKWSLQSPATWAYIWTSLAVLYLVGIYLGSIRIRARG